MPARRSPLSLPCIKNASEGSESGRFGQYRSGTRHRENPYYIGRFSSHTERPGPLGGISNPAGATISGLYLRAFFITSGWAWARCGPEPAASASVTVLPSKESSCAACASCRDCATCK